MSVSTYAKKVDAAIAHVGKLKRQMQGIQARYKRDPSRVNAALLKAATTRYNRAVKTATKLQQLAANALKKQGKKLRPAVDWSYSDND